MRVQTCLLAAGLVVHPALCAAQLTDEDDDRAARPALVAPPATETAAAALLDDWNVKLVRSRDLPGRPVVAIDFG